MTKRLILLALAAMVAVPAVFAPARDAGADIEGDRLTILVIGGDAGPQRSGLRTDTMMVLTVDLDTAKAAVFGVPRNLVGVPLPDGPAAQALGGSFPNLLNELYNYGWAHPELFPGGDNPGATALMSAIGEMLGLPIDHYALVDMPGFVQVIDVVGGVDIFVPEQVLVRISPAAEGEDWQTYDIQPGQQHLDGHQALAYARSREGGSDYDRMLRQRCLLGALVKEVNVGSLLRHYPDFVRVARESVTTDIPLDLLPDLIELADRVDTDEVIALGFNPPDYVASNRADGYPYPAVDRMRATVQAVLAGTPDAAGVPLQTLPATCGWSG